MSQNDKGIIAGAAAQPDWMNALRALSGPIPVANAYYNGKQVPLDGYSFRECRFDNCVLTVHGTNFTLDHCVIDDFSTIQFGQALCKVVSLFTSRYEWLQEALPGPLKPVRNADGTISIGV